VEIKNFSYTDFVSLKSKFRRGKLNKIRSGTLSSEPEVVYSIYYICSINKTLNNSLNVLGLSGQRPTLGKETVLRPYRQVSENSFLLLTACSLSALRTSKSRPKLAAGFQQGVSVKGDWAPLICLLTVLFAPSIQAQDRPVHRQAGGGPPDKSAPPADQAFGQYSEEPYVIEQYVTSVHFENEGSQTRSVSARIRIQSAVAAQKFSQLAFTYDSSTGELEFRRVHILKPDGRSLSIAMDLVKEEPAALSGDASAYGDYREKTILIPDLHPGDMLEYEIVTRIAHPPASGEFWMQHSFISDATVVRENLNVDVPKSRKLNLKSPRLSYTTEVISPGNRIVYHWKHANLAISAEDQKSPSATGQAKLKAADVELTTFATWDDVSRWYEKLQRAQEQPTPEIRAKAIELTKANATDIEKIQALYHYVSHNIRSVNLPFAAAGYPTHSAADVLATGYGAGADKHILLASMLDAVGIGSETALVPDSRILDHPLPSPAQFSHVLTVVLPDTGRIWLDTTTGVAPFQFLPPALRKRSALLISSNGTGQLVETPADPPFLSTQRVEIEGHVSDLGKLAAHVHYQLRGDNEFVLRLAFHQTPQTQWRELAQTILALDGVHGEVISANPGDPTDTDKPFALDIEYSQSDFLDWSSQQARLAMPLLTISMPEAPKKSTSEDFELGSPLEVTTRLKLNFPQRFTVQPPVAISVSRDYAEFKSSYRFDEHSFSAERSLNFKMRAIPTARRDDYLAFSHAVAADQSQSLRVENSATRPSEIPRDATASELSEAGAAALASGNGPSSVPLFERLVELEPTHKEAWNELGLAYMRSKQLDRAVFAFSKQLEVNPSDPQAHNYLGLALQQQHKYEEAALAFRKQTEVNPLDTVAHAALGAIYLSQHEYAEAAPELDKATVLSPDKSELQVSLGQAYAGLGQNEKALAAFEKAMARSPVAGVWNGVARSLAEHNLDLMKAQKYAESAVSAAAAGLQSIDIARVSAEQFSIESKLANYWDTLGWVYFQKGDILSAERYINAAWLLNQRGEMAGHLARIQEKLGQKDKAIQLYALALAAPDADPEARARLTLLLGGNARIDYLIDQARLELTAPRTLPAGKLVNQAGTAEFLMLLSPTPALSHTSRISQTRFLGGNDELRPFGDRLRSIDFGPMFPGRSPAKLARRAMIACSASQCSFTLLPLELQDAAN
jgi:tetratricopeptide (TPR) repeat protein